MVNKKILALDEARKNNSIFSAGIKTNAPEEKELDPNKAYERVFEAWNKAALFINDWHRPVSVCNDFEDGFPRCILTLETITEDDYKRGHVYAEVILDNPNKVNVYLFKHSKEIKFDELKKKYPKVFMTRRNTKLDSLMYVEVTKDGFLTLKYSQHSLSDETFRDIFHWIMNRDIPPIVTRERQVTSCVTLAATSVFTGMNIAGVNSISAIYLLGIFAVNMFGVNVYDVIRYMFTPKEKLSLPHLKND
jgi:hypothetical protein